MVSPLEHRKRDQNGGEITSTEGNQLLENLVLYRAS